MRYLRVILSISISSVKMPLLAYSSNLSMKESSLYSSSDFYLRVRFVPARLALFYIFSGVPQNRPLLGDFYFLAATGDCEFLGGRPRPLFIGNGMTGLGGSVMDASDCYNLRVILFPLVPFILLCLAGVLIGGQKYFNLENDLIIKLIWDLVISLLVPFFSRIQVIYILEWLIYLLKFHSDFFRASFFFFFKHGIILGIGGAVNFLPLYSISSDLPVMKAL